MTATTPSFPSRLPQVGTTIFSTMSALAQQREKLGWSQSVWWLDGLYSS